MHYISETLNENIMLSKINGTGENLVSTNYVADHLPLQLAGSFSKIYKDFPVKREPIKEVSSCLIKFPMILR